MIKLSEAIDFDAADGESVDLIFGMMVPINLDGSHYDDIKMVTQVLRDEGLRARLRSMNNSKDLYDALLNGSELVAPEQSHAAR